MAGVLSTHGVKSSVESSVEYKTVGGQVIQKLWPLWFVFWGGDMGAWGDAVRAQAKKEVSIMKKSTMPERKLRLMQAYP